MHQSYGDQLGLTSSDEEDILHGHSRNSSYDPLVNGADNKVRVCNPYNTILLGKYYCAQWLTVHSS